MSGKTDSIDVSGMSPSSGKVKYILRKGFDAVEGDSYDVSEEEIFEVMEEYESRVGFKDSSEDSESFESLINQYVEDLDTDIRLESPALEFGQFRSESREAESNAAGAVYFASQFSGESYTQEEVAEVAGISPYTVGLAYGDIKENFRASSKTIPEIMNEL